MSFPKQHRQQRIRLHRRGYRQNGVARQTGIQPAVGESGDTPNRTVVPDGPEFLRKSIYDVLLTHISLLLHYIRNIRNPRNTGTGMPFLLAASGKSAVPECVPSGVLSAGCASRNRLWPVFSPTGVVPVSAGNGIFLRNTLKEPLNNPHFHSGSQYGIIVPTKQRWGRQNETGNIYRHRV